MPDPYYDGAVQIAGAFRGYVIGRIPVLRTAIRHYTVGVNSIGTCGRDFQMLQARSGVLYQGAEVDSVNYGAGMPWNWQSVHVEAEWHPEYNADEPILSDAMIDSLRGFAAWLETEWGIRRSESYHGYVGRITDWSGWIDHRWLIQTGDWHSNSWPVEEWARVVAAPPLGEGEDRMQPGLFVDAVGRVWVYDPNGHTKTWVRTNEALGAVIALRGLAGLPVTSPPWSRNDATDALLADARDTDSFSAVGGGAVVGIATTADVLASEQRVRGDVNKARTLT